jgi:hypothetical protein
VILTVSTVKSSVDEISRARLSFFASRFIIWLLTEMRAHRTACSTGAQAHSIFGMMAKKEDEVNMEEDQICWPVGQRD